MEDGHSIAECLRLGGKGRVNLATKVHELLRYQRTALVQRCGFANKSALHDNTMEDIVASDRKPLYYGKWLWAHNAERYATENFDSALESLVSGNPFENANLPPGHQFEDWDVSKEETGACKFATKDLRSNGDWGRDIMRIYQASLADNFAALYFVQRAKSLLELAIPIIAYNIGHWYVLLLKLCFVPGLSPSFAGAGTGLPKQFFLTTNTAGGSFIDQPLAPPYADECQLEARDLQR
ncbi:hypothetical protein NM208_g1435 [Fusarium decemcellulare]|uniref:Uncharacterized protein n=1 Tax=Fusarium decemcellulare TaxID=57161 RepID=A0ACC1SWD5_9HYPO|nr:hypothetical protein NM208_g1435 [Fusarium decemcellulare]